MAERKAPNQEHLGKVAIAEFEAVSEVNHLENDIGRYLDKVEWSAGALVEGFPTVSTTMNGIAQSGVAIELGSTFRLAVGAGHGLWEGGSCTPRVSVYPGDDKFVYSDLILLDEGSYLSENYFDLESEY